MPRRPVSAIVFALLVLATIAAFAWSQRLKRDPLILDKVTLLGVQPRPHGGPALLSRAFTPNGDCRFDRERIRFRVTRSDHATVQVIRPHGRLVATLARDRFLERYHYFAFWWDGRSRGGAIAPPGRYRLRVKLLEGERTLVPPGIIHLHRAPRNPLPGCASKKRPR